MITRREALMGVCAAPLGARDDHTQELRALFLKGGEIRIGPGIWRSSLPLDLVSNSEIICEGTLQMTRPHPAGGFLLIKNGHHNIRWTGGTIDAGGVRNVNAVAIGSLPDTPWVQDIEFSDFRVTGTRVNRSLESAYGRPFSGGGKGVTVQFRAADVRVHDFEVDDCDIGLSVESAASQDRGLSGVVVERFTVHRPGRCPLFVSGSNKSGPGAARYPGAVIRDFDVDAGPSSADVGAITLNYPMDTTISGRVRAQGGTLIRGPMGRSQISVDLIGDVNEAWDRRPLPGLNATPSADATVTVKRMGR